MKIIGKGEIKRHPEKAIKTIPLRVKPFRRREIIIYTKRKGGREGEIWVGKN